MLFLLLIFFGCCTLRASASPQRASLTSVLREIEDMGNPDFEVEDRDPVGLAGVLKHNVYGNSGGRAGMHCQSRRLCNCYSRVLRKWFCCDCMHGPCFPGRAKATVYPGVLVPMDSLKVGDRVMAANPDNGSLVWTRVLTFLDRRPEEVAEYLSLRTSSNRSMELSANHVVLVPSNGAEIEFVSKFARDVKPGDEIYETDGISVIRSKVDTVTRSIAQGAFVPLTAEGTLVVDGGVASCYASFDHHLAHAFMAPVRYAAAANSGGGAGYTSIFEAWLPSYVKFLKWFGHSFLPADGRWQARTDGVDGVARILPEQLSLVDVADTTLAKMFYSVVLSV